jgi:hypothetical protein
MKAQGGGLVRGIFGLIALVASIAGAWYAYDVTSSWALAVFVLLIGANVVGRGIPDLITDPEKGKRLGFFGIPPVLAVVALAGSYWLWTTWWLAVTIGFVFFFVGQFLVTMLFPKVAKEEAADNAAQLGIDLPGGGSQRTTSSGGGHLDAEGAVRLLRDVERNTGVELTTSEEVLFASLVERGMMDEAAELVAKKLADQHAGHTV